MQGGVISRLVKLEQLTLTWSASHWTVSKWEGIIRYPSHAFPNLAVFKHLKQLELRQGTKNMYALASFPKPSQPLPVLQHLVLEQLKITGKLLSSCSTALVTLELRRCEVVDFDGVPTDKLRSLNSKHSRVQLPRSCIIALTQLTFLGLAHSTWQGPAADRFKVFHGWPSLQVLQCNACNLFDHNTEVHVGPAAHLHNAYVRTGMG